MKEILNIYVFVIFNNPAAKMHITRLLKGIKILAVRKSKISKMVRLNSVRFFKTPKDNAAGIEITATIEDINNEALVLVILKFSINAATATSRILIPEVSAAKNKREKNPNATSPPCCI